MLQATVAVLLLAGGALAQDEPAADADRQERLQFMERQAATFTLQRRSADDRPFPLTPEPVLRYSNPERERGSTDGATFLWLDGARPVACISFSIRRPRNAAYHECTSFASEPLECRQSGAVVWSPPSGGLQPRPLDVAPQPASGKSLRLAQMRNLARRFAVTCFHPQTDEPTELRLLSQPLYRFSDKPAGITDGALFAFVVSNDPEMLLLLEAVRGTDQEPAHWQFSLARMSSLKQTVRLDDAEIWPVPNFYKEGDRTEGPYLEKSIGTFEPSGDASAQQN